MSNHDIHNQFAELASKYLSGNASSSEVEELENWVLAAPENKQQFINFKKAWLLTGMEHNSQNVNVEDLWQQTSAQIFGKSKVVEMKPRSTRRRWLSIAAAFLLLAVASFFIFQNTPSNTPFLAEATDVAKNFELADGSQITLNQSSKLSYSFSEKENQRQVNLEGDAFFEVARDEKNSFIIQTQNVEIEVLGTSFYVDSRVNQNEIQVIVQSGKVAVRSGGVERILTANEKAIFKKNSNQLSKEENQDANFMALKTKTLVFENSKLEEVVFVLNRQFNANILIENNELRNCEYTTTFTNKSLDAILIIMESSLGIQAKRNGKTIVLTGVCNKE